MTTDHTATGISGRRVFITGAARGIGAALARRLSERGARVALAGLEHEFLESVAQGCDDAPNFDCDVRDRNSVERAVQGAVAALGGLDVVVANAGVAAQLPVFGGDPSIFEKTVAVNLLGTYYTLRAAGPHVAHRSGYALAVSSLAAAINLPLLAAYSSSKAGVEALANTLRVELMGSGARVGVAYFAQLDTDMTRRGFSTRAGAQLTAGHSFLKVAPLQAGLSALERGIARRSRVVAAPRWVRPLLSTRMVVQPVVERFVQRGLAEALAIAAEEVVTMTTELGPVGDAPEGGDERRAR